MEREHYINQYLEVAESTKGMTMDQVREHFGDAVTNDIPDTGLFDSRIIDANYKDILVTFMDWAGVAKLARSIECYDENGAFVDLVCMDNN